MEEEIWKDVIGYEGLYKVSSLGSVLSLSRHRLFQGVPTKTLVTSKILSPNMGTNKYISVQLSRDSKVTRRMIHRLVALAFLPNPKNKPFVNHINGIKTDNRVENLEWSTSSENNKHAVATGLRRTGDKNPTARIKSKEVCEIRELWLNNEMTNKDIKKKFGISNAHLHRILRFERRKQG